MKKLLFVSALLALVAGCSEGGGGGGNPLQEGFGLPELTEAQEDQIRLVSTSFGEVTDMVGEDNVGPNTFGSNVKALANGQLKQKLRKAINEQRCRESNVGTQDDQKTSKKRSINGSNCPVDYVSDLSYTNTESSLVGKGTENYLAKQGMEIYSSTDIYKYSIESDFNIKVDNQTETSQTVIRTTESNGNVYSQSSNTIKLLYKENSNVTQEFTDSTFNEKGTTRQVTDLTFADFRAVGIIQTPIEDPKGATFIINGKDVTRVKYESIFGPILN